MEKKLILFDIDGTLLHSPGTGRSAFQQAFDEALGWVQSVAHINFAGATDLSIFRSICIERGVETTTEMERAFFDCLGPALNEKLTKYPLIVFPAIKSLLEKISMGWEKNSALGLTGSTGWKLGIVTGNIETTAWIKLHHAGLAEYFSFGGFGCRHVDRAKIARQALTVSGINRPEHVFLVGDTPNDIYAAKTNGFVSIAVATGGFDSQALERAGADYVFEDFSDEVRILSILEQV